jgi:hypothetical protein
MPVQHFRASHAPLQFSRHHFLIAEARLWWD